MKVEKMTKKKGLHHLVLSLVLLLVLASLYGWGHFYYQRSNQIERIVLAVNNPKDNLAQYVTGKDPDLKVTNANLKPLQNYFAKNPQAYQKLVHNLKNNRTNSQISLSQTGTYFFIFPKYTLRVPVFRPQVKTNHANSELTVDKKKLGIMQGANQNYYSELGMVFPGRYHLSVKTKVGKRLLTSDSVVNIWSDKTINMAIKTASFQIRSVPNGVVYLNDKKLTTLNEHGQASFTKYPLTKSMELYVESSYQGQKIKSETVKDLATAIKSDFADSDDSIDDYDQTNYAGNQKQDVYQDVEGDYVVNPLWTGLISKQEAGRLLYQTYLKLNVANFDKQKKNKSYQALKKSLTTFKKHKQNLKLAVNILQILPAGDNYSSVDYQLVYKFKVNGKNKKLRQTFHKALFHMKDKTQLIQALGEKIK